MTTCELEYIIVDDHTIEIVDQFNFLGVLITNDGVTDKEPRRRLAMGKYAMGSLNDILQDMLLQKHQPNDQKNDYSNTVISNYLVWSRNLDYQIYREGKN